MTNYTLKRINIEKCVIDIKHYFYNNIIFTILLFRYNCYHRIKVYINHKHEKLDLRPILCISREVQ